MNAAISKEVERQLTAGITQRVRATCRRGYLNLRWPRAAHEHGIIHRDLKPSNTERNQ
jgi:serine/threonine protein kinase